MNYFPDLMLIDGFEAQVLLDAPTDELIFYELIRPKLMNYCHDLMLIDVFKALVILNASILWKKQVCWIWSQESMKLSQELIGVLVANVSVTNHSLVDHLGFSWRLQKSRLKGMCQGKEARPK